MTIHPDRMLFMLAACALALGAVVAYAQPALTDPAVDARDSSAEIAHIDTQELLHDAVKLIEQRVAEGLARDGAGGVTVGIVIGNELAWTESYGFADEASATPASRGTVYRIASISKSFTGLMLAQLAEEGVLNYSDPAEKYIPELHATPNPWSDGSPITLLQLANMTAGVQREPDNVHAHGYLTGPTSEWEATTLRALTECRIVHEPGSRYAYSNMGYSLLGIALGRAAETPFIEYQLSKIIRPLGMSDTVFDLDDELRRRLATGYVRNQDGSIDAERAQSLGNDYGYKIACGGLYSTVDDLAKFVAFQLGNGPDGVAGPGALARTHTGFQANGDLSYGYGIGLTATRRGEMVFLGNLGGTYGFASAMYFHPKTGAGVIVLRNATGNVFREDELCFDALELVVKKAEPEIDTLIEESRSAFDTQQWDAAVAAYAPLSHRSLLNGRDSYQFGFALFAQGSDLQEAIRWFRTAYDLDRNRAEAAYFTASCHALLGDPDQAFDWLATAREAGVNAREYIANDPNLRTLHSDPRFQQYLASLPPAD